jgi:hypothetical protein
MGGAVELVSNMYGPGFIGRRLIDGLLDPTWKVQEKLADESTYPFDIVLSFFERQPATIESVVIVLPEDVTMAPKDVEVWMSPTDLHDGYTKVAVQTLAARPGEHAIAIPNVEAKFVKLRITSSYLEDIIEIAEVRVVESSQQGHVPLFTRAPAVKYWKGSPREAAQRGLDWLQQAAPVWTRESNCFGCHVQSQVLMGQAVAIKHGYRVNMRSVQKLATHVRETSESGTWGNSDSAAVFGTMGLAYAAEATGGAGQDGVFEAADHLLARQDKDGSVPVDHVEPPIVQGRFMTTANAIGAVAWAAAHATDPKYTQFVARGAAWLAAAQPTTNQDKVFKIIGLMHHGTADQKRTAWSVVETLVTDQQPDGGWKESATVAGSNAIATGQALYAFKQAGVSIQTPMFRRGVDYLLARQVNDPSPDNGVWNPSNTVAKRQSAFAHTMWAVIGLAGSYAAEPPGALRIVKQQGDKPPSRNLLIVLDVSGSMNLTLGETSRWKTALDVLTKVVGALPEDMNVGLRVYGHRFASKSSETCTDSELVVPIAKLDRTRILSTASNLRPRGETPLIHSALQTLKDLKAVGGGSVVLITDGEESCGGDAKVAAAAIKASGLNVTLNIVGFTLTGQASQAELDALAGSTGGRYHSAQDGAQLSRAVMLAALHRLPYDILDKSGNVLVSGQTSELGRELPPGTYRLRIDAFGQVLEEPIAIAPNQTTSLALGVDGDRLVIRR